jgi:hypothetical protein
MEFLLATKISTFHERENYEYINCIEFLISSLITAHKLPYHWLFSSNWGFYYTNIHQFEARNPFFTNVTSMYGMEIKHYESVPLDKVIQEVRGRNSALYTAASGYFNPFSKNYRLNHTNHMVAVLDFDPVTNKVLVYDPSPIFRLGWVDFETVNEGFIYKGMKAFEIMSPPNITPSKSMMMEQLESCLKRMNGGVDGDTCSGLLGLNKFYDQILDLGEETSTHLKIITHNLREIIRIKDGFLEFLLYLHHEPSLNFNITPHPELLELIDRTCHSWIVFRNRLMMNLASGGFKFDRTIESLKKIIALEHECSENLNNFIKQQ